MKTVGVIGGLGPETTAQFYLELVFACLEINAKTRPPILMWNVPIPLDVEEEFITHTVGEDIYVPLLIDAARRLEQGGADFIVIPCNSVHIFIDEVRNSVKIPILSIVEETVNFLSKKNLAEVGILATSVTLRKKLYEQKLKEKGIKVVAPNEEDQTKMGHIINHLVQATHTDEEKKELLSIVDTLVDQGVETIILACTDLQLLVPEHDEVVIFDTMKILVESVVREIVAE